MSDQVVCFTNDGSCVRLRPEYRNHVWSYDFVHCRTNDGKAFRTLNILDEHSRECLTIRVRRRLNSTDVIDALTDLFILRGVPAYIRSDNGPFAIELEPMAPSMAHFVAQGRPGLDRSYRGENGLYRTRLTLGEWLLRELQRPVPRRTPEQ